MFELFVFGGLLMLGLFAGTLTENQHLQNLREREKQVRTLSVVNFGANQPLPNAQEAILVTGSVVLTSDFFRVYLASILSLLGGNIGVYESLLDRGRREAMLRMKEEAIARGASQILNVRLETSNITAEGTNQAAVLEIIAYGTAIR